MGTVLSTHLFSYKYARGEWEDVRDIFQEGLYRGAREQKEGSKSTLHYERKLAAAFGKIDQEMTGDGDPEASDVEEEPLIVKRDSRQTSKSAFQPPQSRLPAPIKSRRLSNTGEGFSSNNNELSSIPVKENSAIRHISDLVNFNSENPIQGKPYHPEAWPTSEMVFEHLNKLESAPTTILFARFVPRNSKAYVDIRYSFNKTTNETVFYCSDKLDALIQNKDGNPVGESQAEQIEYFFLIFKTCINLLQGQVWWNGFSLVFDQNSTKNRLKVSAFETEPSQILFELANMKDVEVHRSTHKVELRTKIENGSTEEVKSFRIRGPIMRNVKVNKLRGTLITIHVPEFTPELIPRN